ncbi:unnamed protein product [Lupinus luteus]|uniref:Uncharacterized protein n=1 Tax=Lupinus luteus TaxID=3873 RepID=A0AAV1XLC7_LUPLU
MAKQHVVLWQNNLKCYEQNILHCYEQNTLRQVFVSHGPRLLRLQRNTWRCYEQNSLQCYSKSPCVVMSKTLRCYEQDILRKKEMIGR